MIKALTVKPRFAYQILSGEKKIENRTWGAKIKNERILLHAGAPVCEIIGEMLISEVITVEEAFKKFPSQREYICGPLCWVIADVKAIVPIKIKGRLSLWSFGGGEIHYVQ